jgi:hypothetical protein
VLKRFQHNNQLQRLLRFTITKRSGFLYFSSDIAVSAGSPAGFDSRLILIMLYGKKFF